MPDLDELIRRHYAARSLPPRRVEAILARARPRRAADPNIWRLRMAAVAAGMLLCFGLFHVWMRDRDAAERVLAEIAMNHRKQLDVEVAAEDFSAVVAALDRLDFTARPPLGLGDAFVPVGGRYCSIQGALAAQLKLRHRETGAAHTLYAAPLTPELAGLAGTEAAVDGLPIRLWSDGEVFFGLAGREAAPPGRRRAARPP